MMKEQKNITLIGMPGAGKSTVGIVLAKKLAYGFVDGDLVIQERHGKILHDLIEQYGIEGFWKLESEAICSIQEEKAVIATGGSVCYEPEAMEYLAGTGVVVYLKITLGSLKERLGDLSARGVTLREGQTLEDLYEERVPLYEKYADITIECDDKLLREVVEEVSEAVEKYYAS